MEIEIWLYKYQYQYHFLDPLEINDVHSLVSPFVSEEHIET